jgi:hypothetical protein
VVAGLALAGIAACVVATTYYLAEYPSYQQLRSPGMGVSLPPVTAVVLAVLLAGCLWLALRPPRWLVGDRLARRFGVAMALALVAGFVLVSRQQLRSAELDVGLLGYLLSALPVLLLAGSAAAAAVGRSFRAGLWACAWATVLGAPLLVATWLVEALRWHQQRGQLLLDGEGGLGLGANLVGANLGDAIWWTLVVLALWAVPLGVLGAAAGSWRARRRRARQHADLAATASPAGNRRPRCGVEPSRWPPRVLPGSPLACWRWSCWPAASAASRRAPRWRPVPRRRAPRRPARPCLVPRRGGG